MEIWPYQGKPFLGAGNWEICPGTCSIRGLRKWLTRQPPIPLKKRWRIRATKVGRGSRLRMLLGTVGRRAAAKLGTCWAGEVKTAPRSRELARPGGAMIAVHSVGKIMDVRPGIEHQAQHDVDSFA
jgi:hypothetical protein